MLSKNISNIEIRKAVITDIDKIKKIINITFQSTYKDPETGEELFAQIDLDGICKVIDNVLSDDKNKNHLIFVVSDGGSVVGFAKIDKENEVSFLDKLYVLPNFHGKNYGSLLLLNCLKAARDTFNCNIMRLGVWGGNLHAIDLYKKNNFKIDKPAKLTTSVRTSHGHEMVCEDINSAYVKLETYLRSFKGLSDNLVLLIFKIFSDKELGVVAQVNRHFNKLIDSIERTVKVNTGSSLHFFPVKRTTKIVDLKKQIEDKTRIKASEQKLMFFGKELDDNKRVSNHGVADKGNEICLVRR